MGAGGRLGVLNPVLTGIRYLGTLYGLQIVMSGLAYMVFDLWWLSMPIGLAFLALVWMAGRSLPADLDGDRYGHLRARWPLHGLVALLVGSAWQVPGLLATVRFVREQLGVAEYDGVSDLLDFLCESWHMALLPLLAAIPAGTVDGYHARYYIALLAASPVLVLLLTAASVTAPRRR